MIGLVIFPLDVVQSDSDKTRMYNGNTTGFGTDMSSTKSCQLLGPYTILCSDDQTTSSETNCRTDTDAYGGGHLRYRDYLLVSFC